MSRISRATLELVLPLALAACVAVEPASQVNRCRAPEPRFDTVAIDGFVFRDERVVGRSVSNYAASAAGSGGAYVNSPGGTATVASYGRTSVAGTGVTIDFQSFENDELQVALRRELEESGVARQVVASATARIEGVILSAGPSTGAGRITWNVLNTISFLYFFGSPYLGTADATVQLRIYDGDAFTGVAYGSGRAEWMSHAYGLLGRLDELRKQASLMAVRLAIADAVAQLAAGPQSIRDQASAR